MGFLKQSKKKVSIDFSEKAYQLLAEYTQKMRISNSALINFLLENFLSMGDEEKKQWTEFCIEVLKKENDIRPSISNDFEIRAQNRKIERYCNFIDFFATQKDLKVFENMEKIHMENGYIIYPNDWIVINYREPEKCKYAGAVAIRNSHEYNVPIFLFFSDIKIKELSEYDENEIYRRCKEKYPDFERILAMQVIPAYNSEGKMLNAELLDKAPMIGIFQISEYAKNDVYPYGAMVVPEDE